ncbi:Protein polybromo-like protein [Emericellopsis cladophorae]|uniref:Protein polybromo-like protein n=1 Tax=Emericellopsis cladophorae TaxID=2686198 RepID=A0A9Q0BFW4_9HYPO|nr:Protein polybromo-like protein [Emericellopsis cladophorae]KAI6783351.1 Protein polybromo-like protein [Emericellopsis cladophorae]
MESKRKANGAASPDYDDRAAKRRKVVESYDLSKGETQESTTAYGLSLLDQIRRTSDKSGRRVAGYFETLPPRQGNEEYYARTRMPISFETIEEKLQNGDFQNLSELESYLKRMITNAKEWFHKSSSEFDDAERVRKAVSNYMTKNNPAYQNRNYQAVATPLPEDGAMSTTPLKSELAVAKTEGAADDVEDDADDGEENGTETPRKLPPAKPDHQYEDVPYKGLNFQQAQEKIVEEGLRHSTEDYDGPYFEPFINLPPRSLKDYYSMIKEPMCLKKLQKLVRGVQGRNDVTGVTELKSWAQFEEKAKLLWTNAYYYNEDGSDIFVLAQELETFLKKEIKEAKAHASEPSQPKIKLKVGNQQSEPPSNRKITLNVGNSRGVSTDSPVPNATASPAPVPEVNGTGQVQPSLAVPEKTRSVSVAAPSPSPSVAPTSKGEETRVSPSVRPPSATPAYATPGPPRPGPHPPVPAQPQFQPLPAPPMEQKRLRLPGKGQADALISQMRLLFHRSSGGEPTATTVMPDRKEMQQSATVNLPADSNRMTMTITLPELLQERHYSLWAMFDRHNLKCSTPYDPQQAYGDRVFEAMLHQGLNVIEVHLIAAIPKHERLPGGPDTELEIFTVYANVMRN